jgi:hypothetical protein
MPSDTARSTSTELAGSRTGGTCAAAYGFRVHGLEAGAELAVRGAEGWPLLRVERRIDSRALVARARVTESDASIPTPAGHLILDRATYSLAVCSSELVADSELVHPGLWPAAAVLARWQGAETLHAGAFLADERGAWGVVGARESGKSSLLAALALADHHVLADDLLVVSHGECFAGPRCIDLRPPSAAALGVEAATSPVRSTQRRRLPLPVCEGRVPLLGFVYLAWGDEICVEAVPPAEHFGLLVHHRRIATLGADLDALLDLAGLPAVRLYRPQRWSAVGGTCNRLISALAALST